MKCCVTNVVTVMITYYLCTTLSSYQKQDKMNQWRPIKHESCVSFSVRKFGRRVDSYGIHTHTWLTNKHYCDSTIPYQWSWYEMLSHFVATMYDSTVVSSFGGHKWNLFIHEWVRVFFKFQTSMVDWLIDS